MVVWSHCEAEGSQWEAKVRILYIVHNTAWRGGGTFYRALHLGRYMARRGHAVTLLATSETEQLRFRSQRVEALRLVESPDLLRGSLRSGWDPWNTLRRVVWVGSRPFDLVHAFESRPTVIYPALWARRRWQARLVMDWCDWFGRGGSVAERPSWAVRHVLGPAETFYEEAFRTRADGSTVINNQLRKRAVGLGVPEETILRLPQGSDVENIRPLDKAQARQRLGLPQGRFIIGYLGQLFRSDARLLADAFSCLPRERCECLLLLIGNRTAEVRSLVETPAAVLETGYVSADALNQYLGACDLFWLPMSDTLANRGRFPSKINDYIAAGRPTIATAVGDVVDLFDRHRVGWLARPDAEDIAQWTVVVKGDPATLQEMGHSARETAQRYYAWETLVERLDRFYTSVMEGKLGHRPCR